MKILIAAAFLLVTTIVASSQSASKIETLYDENKNLTTVRLGPIQIANDKGRYHSLGFSLSREYPGRTAATPTRINFDLVSVSKTRRLNTDLYVVFIMDGKPIHFSSNRSAIPNPVPGRLWIGERMVFLIPYEDFGQLVGAEKLSIKMGDMTFDFGSEPRQALRTFFDSLKQPH